MCGVRKLTHTTYANQRMTLNSEIAKFQVVKRNTMIALRGAIHGYPPSEARRRSRSLERCVFSSFMFCSGRLAMPLSDVGVWAHSTSFLPRFSPSRLLDSPAPPFPYYG